jgi:hypothetical protein
MQQPPADIASVVNGRPERILTTGEGVTFATPNSAQKISPLGPDKLKFYRQWENHRMVASASRSRLRDSRNGQADIQGSLRRSSRSRTGPSGGMFISRLLPNSLKPQRLSSADSPRLLRRYRYGGGSIALSIIEADNVKVAVRISTQSGSSVCGRHSAYWWFSAGPERQEAPKNPSEGMHLFTTSLSRRT